MDREVVSTTSENETVRRDDKASSPTVTQRIYIGSASLEVVPAVSKHANPAPKVLVWHLCYSAVVECSRDYVHCIKSEMPLQRFR